MRNNKYEERQIIQKVLVETEIICDICCKHIGYRKGYWKVHTWHDDWGNDSIESHEHFDVCSTECLIDKFKEYCDESSSSAYNTMQIEVEHTVYA